MNINNLSIGARLSAAFAIIAALVIAAALDGGWGLRSIAHTALEVMNGDLKVAQLAAQIDADVLQLRRYEKDIFINIDAPDKVRSYRAKWDQALEAVEEARSVAEELAGEELHGPISELKSELRAYAEGFEETFASINSGALTTTAQANEAMTKHKAAVHQTEVLVDKIREAANRRAAGAGGVISKREREVMTTLTALTALSLIFAAALAIVITRGISRPLKSAVKLAQSVADGELGHKIEEERSDEVGQLLKSLHQMDRKLSEIIGEVSAGVSVVRMTAAELAESNDLISQRTQEQAGSLEQTAASLEEMTASVQGNAAGAGRAHQLARSAHEAASAGGATVTKAVAAMDAISTASRQIADIIGVIDEIAFQTNLLALNAAVEAARAGESGRGFAVVAGEVRNLAQRSAESAKQIKALIGDSVEKVRAGAQLVVQSGEHLRNILDNVRKVTEVAGEIAAANSQQATGVTQLNDAVAQLDAMTQKNAAAVEEISAASKLMCEQSERLAHKTGYFRINGGSSAASAPELSRANEHSAPAAASSPELRYVA